MRSIFLSLAILFSIAITSAKPFTPDSETAKSEVELGVEGIQRLCPTSMWDNWLFRDIAFDRDSNRVSMIIQLDSCSEDEEELSEQANEANELKHKEWIVSNLKNAYEDLIENPRIMCDGDFMLYLSVGTLLKQMKNDGTTLRIMLLKPDGINQVLGDIPLELSAEQLNE